MDGGRDGREDGWIDKGMNRCERQWMKGWMNE